MYSNILFFPAGAGVPEVNLAVQNEGNQNLPVFIPDQVVGEYGGEYEAALAGPGGDLPPVFGLFDIDYQIVHIRDLLEREDSDDSSVWSDRSDQSSVSEYESTSESEEEEEDDEGEDVRPDSPLDQEFQPDDFWQGWRQVDTSAVVSPLVQAGLPSAGPLVSTHSPAGPAVPDDDSRVRSDWTDLSLDSGYGSMSESEEEEEDEDSSVWSDWTDLSSVFGYWSMSESESEEEDDEGEDVRPDSPLDQEFPPDDFWQGWRQVDPSVVVSPLPSPTHSPAGPAVPADPPVSAGPVGEEPTPSTSGLGSSTKRSREESPAAQQSAKRQRRDNGDVDHQQPSTSSGLCPFPVRGYWPAPYEGSDSEDSDSD